MAKYAGKLDKNEIYEQINIGDSILTVHGTMDIEQELYGDQVLNEWEEFYVSKCFIEYEFDGKTFYFEASEDFIKYLNNNYAREIARQALEADYA